MMTPDGEEDSGKPLLLNFTIVRCRYIDLLVLDADSGQERCYHLRDDVPTTTMLDMFSIQPLTVALQRASTPEKAKAALTALEDHSYALAAAIVRHTYPSADGSDPAPYPAMQAELRRVLTPDQIAQVLQVFFTRRYGASNAPPPATPASSPSVTSETDPASKTSSKPALTPKKTKPATKAPAMLRNRAGRRSNDRRGA